MKCQNLFSGKNIGDNLDEVSKPVSGKIIGDNLDEMSKPVFLVK